MQLNKLCFSWSMSISKELNFEVTINDLTIKVLSEKTQKHFG